MLKVTLPPFPFAKSCTITLIVLFGVLTSPSSFATEELYRSLTNGECGNAACFNRYNYRSLTNGECSDAACFNRYNYRSLTNGECSDAACFNRYNYRSLTNGECSDAACFNRYTYRSLTNGRCSDATCYNKQTIKTLSNGQCETITCYCSLYPCPTSGGGRSGYSYDVSGYGDTGYAYGNVDADRSGNVDGYLYLENGTEVYFEGEFTGNGEIEGYDENGNFVSLEVD